MILCLWLHIVLLFCFHPQKHILQLEWILPFFQPYATRKYGKYIGTCVKILDMTGLKLSALNQIKVSHCSASFSFLFVNPIENNLSCPCFHSALLVQLLTVISTIDDLNYPEKTETYYIVNPPHIFSACWKVSTCLGASLFYSTI